MSMSISSAELARFIHGVYDELGYTWFDGENGDGETVDWDLNLGAARYRLGGDIFADLMWCVCRVDGEWRVWLWRITTTPGIALLETPMNSRGSAIMVPGQYRGLWVVDNHGGASGYRALCQRGAACKIYRDADRDAVVDLDPRRVETAYTSMNAHHSGKRKVAVSTFDELEAVLTKHRAAEAAKRGTLKRVGRWSGGCQVHAALWSFYEMMHCADMQQVYHPTWKSYTYTLVSAVPDPMTRHVARLERLKDWYPGFVGGKGGGSVVFARDVGTINM